MNFRIHLIYVTSFTLASAALLSACGQGNRAARPAPSTQPAALATIVDSTTPALQLPIEVLGDGSPARPVVAQISLNVNPADLAAVSQLTFVCHRCGFFGAPEFEATSVEPARVKASVRVLGSADGASVAWIPVTDATVQPADPERIQGGLHHGGMYTTRISLKFDAATMSRLVASPRSNRVQFRFNGTEGETNGYRVLNAQLQDRQGRTLSTNPVQHADIGLQKTAGRLLTEDAKAGDVLWHAQDRLLKSSIVRRPIRAACASCHAADGRDLQYFNYSNNAIVQRSRFHGLSETQGRQIAAYLRFSQRHVPHVPRAAPWQPPYQPGPGSDLRTPVEWAAGAGLGAVLDTPLQAAQALFGKRIDNQVLSLTQAEVDHVMNSGATLNTRDIAIALQLPDWNAWLPSVHPMDIWPANAAAPTGSFETGGRFSAGGAAHPNGHALKIDAWLAANRNPNGLYGDWSHLTPAQRATIQSTFRGVGWEAYRFLGGGRGDHIAASGEYGAQVGASRLTALAAPASVARDPAAFSRSAMIERATASVLQWNAVRQWGWAHQYGLEGNQRHFLGTHDVARGTWTGRGEVRGWPFNTVSVFFLAPHMLYQQERNSSNAVTREWVFAWERDNKVGSYYRSNAWYQLQMVLNPGAQDIFSNYPMDWNYQVNFNHVLAKAIGRATPQAANLALAHHVRNVQSHVKLAQYVNNAFALNAPDPAAPNDIWKNRGMLSRATALKYVAPSHDYLLDFGRNPGDRSPYRDLDGLSPGLYGKVVNGALAQFNTLYASTPAANWRRCDPDNVTFGVRESYASFRFCLDRTRSALPRDAAGYRMNGGGLNTTDQMMQYSLWQATELQAEPARLRTYADWINRMWP